MTNEQKIFDTLTALAGKSVSTTIRELRSRYISEYLHDVLNTTDKSSVLRSEIILTAQETLDE